MRQHVHSIAAQAYVLNAPPRLEHPRRGVVGHCTGTRSSSIARSRPATRLRCRRRDLVSIHGCRGRPQLWDCEACATSPRGAPRLLCLLHAPLPCLYSSELGTCAGDGCGGMRVACPSTGDTAAASASQQACGISDSIWFGHAATAGGTGGGSRAAAAAARRGRAVHARRLCVNSVRSDRPACPRPQAWVGRTGRPERGRNGRAQAGRPATDPISPPRLFICYTRAATSATAPRHGTRERERRDPQRETLRPL